MQEWFNQVINAVKEWIQSPLGTTIISITTTFIYVLIFLSKTSLGKKLYNRMKAKYDEMANTARETRENVKEIEILAKEEITRLKDEYEQKLSIAVSYSQELEKLIYEIEKITPNAKIRDAICQFREGYEERMQYIRENIPTVQEINAVYDELVQEHRDFEERLQNARTEIENALREEYQKAFEKIVAELTAPKGENENGEGEENQDTNPEEETV